MRGASRFSIGSLLWIASIIFAVLTPPAAAAPARLHLEASSSRDDVLQWIDSYRKRPDPTSVPIAMQVLSQRGVLRDPDTAGVYVGFLAGIIGTRPAEPEGIVGKVLPALAEEDQWIMVRAIAYAGLPDWKALLAKFAARMPSRRVMIDKYLDGSLPALDAVPLEAKTPAMLDKIKSYFASNPAKHDALTFDASPELLDTLWGIYFATGESPKRRGNAHATIVPYETFEASDGWISLGVANDELWKRFCKAVERPELTDDPRFAKAADRVRSRDVLVPIVKDIIKQRKRDEWLPLMEAAGIPSGGVRTVGEVCESALLQSRDMIAEMPHAGKGVGIVKNIKNPMHLSDTPLDTYAAPPRLGEHTREILTGLLGYSASEVKELARSETI